MLFEISNTIIFDKTAPRYRRIPATAVGSRAPDPGQAKNNNSNSSTLVPNAETCVNVEGMKTDAGYSGCHGGIPIVAG